MITIDFKRNLSSNVLVINCPEDYPENDFTVSMLQKARPDMLLPFEIKHLDGKACFCYDITSKQPFDKVYYSGSVNKTVLDGFLNSLLSLSRTLDEFLLDCADVLIRKDCIFMDLDRTKYYFCLCPAGGLDFAGDFTAFCDQLLSLLDYSDREAVATGFSLSRLAHSENFSFSLLEGLLDQARPQAHEKPVFPDSAINGTAFEDDPEDLSEIGPSLQPEYRASKKKNSGSLSQKLKGYFHGKNAQEVIGDINSGAIFKKVKDFEPDITFSEAKPAPKPGEDYLNIPGQESMIFMEDVQYVDISTEDTINLSAAMKKERRLIGLGKSQDVSCVIDHYPFTLGKLQGQADFDPGSPYISRLHGRIYREDGSDNEKYLYEDLNSRNGSLINDRRLDAYTKYPLSLGDVLTLADAEFLFR